MLLPSLLVSLFFLLSHELFQVAGYSFELTSVPTQCGTLAVNLTQGQGVPPYTIIVSPIGPSPTTVEKRNVLSTTFNGNSATLQLTYPANSNFLIAVGDSNGIATGGTTATLNVQSSSDDSCLPAQIDPDFTFQLIPDSITQCQTTMFGWNPSLIQGSVSVQLLIQQGVSETLPVTPAPSSGGLALVNWLANVPVGTLYVLVVGDDRGFGNGGTVTGSVDNNPSGDNSCLVANSPSMTPQAPPGAIVTQTTGGSSTPSSPSSPSSPSTPSPPAPIKPSSDLSSKDSIIIGSAVGGGAAIIIFILSLLVCMRRRQRKKQQRNQPSPPPFVPEIHENYGVEPFIIPPSVSNLDSGSFPDNTSGSARFSRVQYSAVALTDTDSLNHDQKDGQAMFASPFEGSGSGSGSSSFAHHQRPVTIVQHSDGGRIPGDLPSPPPQRIVELPPTYDTIGESSR